MNFYSVSRGLVLLWLALASVAMAQSDVVPLNSPIEGGIPAGSGAGVHSPNSPFAPLKDRADVVPWTVLTAITTRTEKGRILPVFTPTIQAMHQTKQRLQGFMMPLEPGERQKHFLISSVPLTCSFCIPGGPESMVEVRTKTPVKYSMEAVVGEGQFAVLKDDPYGLYYRITEAVSVK